MGGNCGTSFFYLYDLSGLNYAFRTGFGVDSAAYDFDWQVLIHGENATQAEDFTWEDFGPQVPSTSWTSGYVTTTQGTDNGTYYYGRVTYGAAYLVNGGVCYAGKPNAGQTLYW